jgi:hypothetical protein
MSSGSVVRGEALSSETAELNQEQPSQKCCRGPRIESNLIFALNYTHAGGKGGNQEAQAEVYTAGVRRPAPSLRVFTCDNTD